MHDIKFRVWNTSLKGYVPEDIVYLSPDGSLLFGSIMMNDAIYIKPNFQKYKDALLEGENIIEQYTGLKDKNDKEIYEGDILALYHRDGSIVNLCQVFWNELDNEYDWKPVGEDSWSDLFSAFYDDYKVVGNVHECTFN